jgi:hypothetical protein
MNNDLLRRELISELKAVYETRTLEMQLIEQFDFAFNWVMRAAEKNNIELPNELGIHQCLQRIAELMKTLHPTTRDAIHDETTRQRKRTKIIAIHLSP